MSLQVKFLAYSYFHIIEVQMGTVQPLLRNYAKNPVSDKNCCFFREILTLKPGF